MACTTKPDTTMADLLGKCLPDGAPQKVKNLTVGDLWRIGGFRRVTDKTPTSQNPDLALTVQEKKVLADAFVKYVHDGTGAEKQGTWTYDMNYISVCCCCTT